MKRGEGLITPEVAIGRTDAEDSPGSAVDVASVFRDHQLGLLRVAYLLCGDHDVAQDLVSEAFAKSYRHLERGRVNDPYAYLRRAVVNAWKRQIGLRVRARRARPSGASHTPEFDKGTVERDRVLRSLDDLSTRQRAVVVLRYLDDFSEADTAAALRMSRGSVKSHTHRAEEAAHEPFGGSMNNRDEQTLRDLLEAATEHVEAHDDLWPTVEQRARQDNRRTVMLQVASVVVLLGASVGGWLMWESRTGGSETVVAAPDSSPPAPAGTDPAPLENARWQSMPDAPIGSRFQHLALDMDGDVLVWGGYQPDGEPAPGGAIYDTAAETWRTIDDGPFPQAGPAIGVWTGSEAIVLQGDPLGPPAAAAFNPAEGTWRELTSPPGGTSANAVGEVVWTGANVVLVADGAAGSGTWIYDPATDSWATGATPASIPDFPSVSWTGTEVIFVDRWAGSDDPAQVSGAVEGVAAERSVTILAYNPTSDTWRELPRGPMESRSRLTAVWTGSRLVVIGFGETGKSASAGLLDPARNSWTEAAPPPNDLLENVDGVFAGVRYPPVWDGTEVVLFGGKDGSTPVSFNPANDSWRVGTGRADTPVAEVPAVWSAGRLVQPLGGYTYRDDALILCCDAGPAGGFVYGPS
ncbi:MAG: SigE family RNA polymerase sigma factor [Microthrixaceae bacterium]